MKKLLLLLVLSIGLLSCSDYVKIEQRVSVDSYIDNTSAVETIVWIREWDGSPITIEKSYREFDVLPEKVEFWKIFQMAQALPIKHRLDSVINLKN